MPRLRACFGPDVELTLSAKAEALAQVSRWLAPLITHALACCCRFRSTDSNGTVLDKKDMLPFPSFSDAAKLCCESGVQAGRFSFLAETRYRSG